MQDGSTKDIRMALNIIKQVSTYNRGVQRHLWEWNFEEVLKKEHLRDHR